MRTLLFTDLVDSTKLVESLGDAAGAAVLRRHDRLMRDLAARFGGTEIDKSDGFLVLFEKPFDALRCALEYHEGLGAISSEEGIRLSARAGIHFGEVFLRENSAEDIARGAKRLEVEGLAKAAAARVMALAQPRQTLLGRSAFDLARRSAMGTATADALRFLLHGPYLFKGIDEPFEVAEIGKEGVAPLSPPPNSAKAWRAVSAADEAVFGWRPAVGAKIPRRANWRLEQRLGEGGFGEVWLARHEGTREPRVFKFCFDAERLRGLKREAALFGVLREKLGSRDDITRVLDWSFAEAPYFLESEYTEGGNLSEWCAAQGGAGSVPLDTRLELVAQAADALAAAHQAGILHKDLKPANLLVYADRAGAPRIRLTDFGIGQLADENAQAIPGLTAAATVKTLSRTAGSSSGTVQYMAPEVVEGRPATVRSDVYALGVLLYQALAGDFTRSLAPGWERDVRDHHLRSYVARCVDGEPANRPEGAAWLAQALRGWRGLLAAEERDIARRKRKTLVGVLVTLAANAFFLWWFTAGRWQASRGAWDWGRVMVFLHINLAIPAFPVFGDAHTVIGARLKQAGRPDQQVSEHALPAAAGWACVVAVFPVLGLLAYFLARPLAERRAARGGDPGPSFGVRLRWSVFFALSSIAALSALSVSEPLAAIDSGYPLLARLLVEFSLRWLFVMGAVAAMLNVFLAISQAHEARRRPVWALVVALIAYSTISVVAVGIFLNQTHYGYTLRLLRYDEARFIAERLSRQGDHAGAVLAWRRSLENLEAAGLSGSQEAGRIRAGLGHALAAVGEAEASAEELARARETLELFWGEGSPKVDEFLAPPPPVAAPTP
ncbi:MAG: protein kinase [Candidatus Sumerlaeia bacterium]|nr:protein kinase [Candidatus Sumerlaeia bacterium]